MTKILVIPGSSSTGPILRKVLEKAGHAVELANADSSSFSTSTGSVPSLVITDFMTSNSMSCQETLKKVHEIAPQAKIIALFSGGEDNQPDQKAIARQPGVFRVVHDPFEVGELLETMRKTIETVEESSSPHLVQ